MVSEFLLDPAGCRLSINRSLIRHFSDQGHMIEHRFQMSYNQRFSHAELRGVLNRTFDCLSENFNSLACHHVVIVSEVAC